MGDDMVELSTENESLKKKIGLKQIHDEERANLLIAMKKTQMKKH